MLVSTRLVGLVRQALEGLAEHSAGVVVAVSGGADSVALLRALDAARDPQAPFPLVLAHLNHQLRGAESAGDEEFVTALLASLTAGGRPALSLCRASLDIAGLARARGENLEAVARQERYRWLAEVARSRGMHCIATGHTANDQAETVLHRLLRGTGLRGLRGIAPRRALEPGLTLMRPFLRATRADVLAYLDELGQPHREDSTNKERTFTRNRIRHELLPHLAEHYNPGVVRVLARLAEQADETYAAEEAATRTLLREVELPPAGSLRIFSQARLAAAPRHRVREMFRLVWLRENWPLGEMSHAAWERLADVVFAGQAVDLPGRIRARCRGQIVQVGQECGAGL
jgi:tRNA(Ile)-lysidine synthase